MPARPTRGSRTIGETGVRAPSLPPRLKRARISSRDLPQEILGWRPIPGGYSSATGSDRKGNDEQPLIDRPDPAVFPEGSKNECSGSSRCCHDGEQRARKCRDDRARRPDIFRRPAGPDRRARVVMVAANISHRELADRRGRLDCSAGHATRDEGRVEARSFGGPELGGVISSTAEQKVIRQHSWRAGGQGAVGAARRTTRRIKAKLKDVSVRISAAYKQRQAGRQGGGRRSQPKAREACADLGPSDPEGSRRLSEEVEGRGRPHRLLRDGRRMRRDTGTSARRALVGFLPQPRSAFSPAVKTGDRFDPARHQGIEQSFDGLEGLWLLARHAACI